MNDVDRGSSPLSAALGAYEEEGLCVVGVQPGVEVVEVPLYLGGLDDGRASPAQVLQTQLGRDLTVTTHVVVVLLLLLLLLLKPN